MSAILEFLWNLITALPRRAARALRRFSCGCLLFVFLFVAVLVALGALLVNVVEGQGDEPRRGFLLIFVSDESVSMSEAGGDPQRLRADAARMMIQYLGLESETAGDGAIPAAALIYFGSTPRRVAPPTPLDAAGRAALINLLAAAPAPFGWTDPLAALTLARADAEAELPGRRPVVILLTDGLPEWDASAGPPPGDEYADALRAEAAQLAALEGALFVVLLSGEGSPDPAVARWRPVWEEMAAMTPGGAVYDAHQPADLPALYHDIAAALTGRSPAVAAQAELAGETARHVVPVEPDQARLTLIIAKSAPGITAAVLLPGGRPLTAGSTDGEHSVVRHAAGAGSAAEELWVIDNPIPGDWTVVLSGAGSVTVWKETRPKPTPTAASTPAAPATATTAPSPSPSPTEEKQPSPAAALTLITPPPAVAPVAAAPIVVDPVSSAAAGPAFPWLPMAGLGLAAAGLAVVALRRRSRQAVAAGILRPLPAGAGHPAEIRPLKEPIDLEGLALPRLTLGAPPADVILPGFAARLEIAPGRVLDDGHEMLLRRAGGDETGAAVLVNGRPLDGVHSLADMDVIACGPVTLRYENLRLRSAAWATARDDEYPLSAY
jgi:hypothetical protein